MFTSLLELVERTAMVVPTISNGHQGHPLCGEYSARGSGRVFVRRGAVR
ncbi:hypothetical protein ACFYU5_31235 [Nocardia aobensis]|uniref:Uncharacterized protein n=1 Tax=Nocardia aobensis TaxID=257277 RepID=A0ABW6PCP3_9NOCA